MSTPVLARSRCTSCSGANGCAVVAPDQVKPDQAKPDQTKPDQAKSDQTKTNKVEKKVGRAEKAVVKEVKKEKKLNINVRILRKK